MNIKDMPSAPDHTDLCLRNTALEMLVVFVVEVTV